MPATSKWLLYLLAESPDSLFGHAATLTELSAEEAMAIAADMDADKDGFLTVAELSKWVDNNKVIKLLEDGREGEIDRMIERRKEKLLREMREAEAENGNEPQDEVDAKEAKQ